jgi:hypothetical protein
LENGPFIVEEGNFHRNFHSYISLPEGSCSIYGKVLSTIVQDCPLPSPEAKCHFSLRVRAWIAREIEIFQHHVGFQVVHTSTAQGQKKGLAVLKF